MKRLGFAARLLPFAFATAALCACGGPKGRPNLPPPEYEEPAAPLPPTSSVPAATDAGAR